MAKKQTVDGQRTMKKRFILPLLLIGNGILSLPAHAEGFYAELNGSYTNLDISNTQFNPLAAGFKLGWYLEPQVGLELSAMAGIDGDTDGSLEAELKNAIGLNLRFESPASKEGGKIFLLLGYAYTELDLNRNGTGEPGSETFDGASYGGGFEIPLNKNQNIFWNIQYQKSYDDDDISLDAGSTGIRFQF